MESRSAFDDSVRDQHRKLRETAEYALVFEDDKGWWANLSGWLFGPFKTYAEADAAKTMYQ